ncbi:unnamed protein product, partial [Amoebophrya sp. A25]|eukprot:GSA25T00027392001.1
MAPASSSGSAQGSASRELSGVDGNAAASSSLLQAGQTSSAHKAVESVVIKEELMEVDETGLPVGDSM